MWHSFLCALYSAHSHTACPVCECADKTLLGVLEGARQALSAEQLRPRNLSC